MAGSLHEQMELFAVGGLRDQGGTVDPVSGNKVPIGSTQEEVRDDIPAQLSHGEFVFPADVTRYYGRAVKITDVQDLGDVMINQLGDLFSEKKTLH